MLRRVLLVVALGALNGCTIGQTVSDVSIARQPLGVEVRVSVDDREIAGELLALGDSALLLLGDSLTLIPYRVIRGGQSLRSGGWRRTVQIGPRFTLIRSDREWLRLVSRYPQGASPELVRGLLQAYGQDSVRVVTP